MAEAPPPLRLPPKAVVPRPPLTAPAALEPPTFGREEPVVQQRPALRVSTQSFGPPAAAPAPLSRASSMPVRPAAASAPPWRPAAGRRHSSRATILAHTRYVPPVRSPLGPPAAASEAPLGVRGSVGGLDSPAGPVLPSPRRPALTPPPPTPSSPPLFPLTANSAGTDWNGFFFSSATPAPRRPSLRRTQASSLIPLSPDALASPATSTSRLLPDGEPPAAAPEASPAGALRRPTPEIERATPEARPTPPTPWPGPPFTTGWQRHWPALLFAGNVLGVYVAGLGAIWLERGIYATRPLNAPPAGAPPPPPEGDRPRPDLLGKFTSPDAAIVAGVAFSAFGLALSLVAGWRLWLDGRALAKRHLAGNPRALWRPNIFGAVNSLNQFLWWAYRFRAEATRDHHDIRDTWLNGAMGAVGAAAFAGVQSISLSSSEMLRGEQFSGHRQTLSRLSLAAVGVSYPLFSHFVADPHSSAEVRSTLRVAASAALTVANTIALSHLRRLTPQQIRNADRGVFAPESQAPTLSRRRLFAPHFYPLALLSVHGVGRLLIHIFSVPWAALFQQQDPALSTLSGESPHFVDGPRPAPTLPKLSDAQANLGIALVATGVAIGVAVAVLFGRDARNVRRRDWGWLTAGAVLSSLLVGSHRVLNESQRGGIDARREAASMALGSVGYALEFVTVVSLFAYSQMRHGRPAWRWVDHSLQGTRALGDATLHMWALMAAFPDQNPVPRGFVFALGSFLTQFGLAVPTGIVGHAQAKEAIEYEAWQLQARADRRPS